MANAGDCISLIRDVDRDNVGALLDFGHATGLGEAIGSWLENYEPKKALSKIREALLVLKIKQFRAGLKKLFSKTHIEKIENRRIIMRKYDQSITDILNIEYQVIKELIDTLDRDVMDKIIDLLISVKPSGKKVITAGAGTSGATAIRVAHSLNVCEVPSFFLDPSMSVHGGAGAIQQGDVVILFSKGGNTLEVINYIPICKAKGATIIGVCQNDDSILAKNADIYFKVKIDQESDKFNMCASASCTAYCAVWDAIAFTIMRYTDYSKEDLLLTHPGGKVGELLLKEKDNK